MAVVFISYSHKDHRWKDRLLIHLRVLEKQNLLDVWDDSRLRAGEDWYAQIQRALASAKVAILLISANFLSSDFILQEEVPRLLERRRSEGLYVIPVVVTPCVWQQIEWLKKMQVELFRGKALAAGGSYEIEEHLTDIAARVIKCLPKEPSPVPAEATPDIRADRSEEARRSLRILIADDHTIVLQGLSRFLQDQDDIEVVGQVKDGCSAVEFARAVVPDIILMDIQMPALNGIDATRMIHRELPSVKIIALAMSSARRHITEMFCAGASGYLIKDCGFDELLLAIRVVSEGKTYVSPLVSNTIIESLVHPEKGTWLPAFPLLTQQERKVLELLAGGRTNKQIALQLRVRPETVERHRVHITDKLKSGNLVQLVEDAVEEGTFLSEPAPDT